MFQITLNKLTQASLCTKTYTCYDSLLILWAFSRSFDGDGPNLSNFTLLLCRSTNIKGRRDIVTSSIFAWYMPLRKLDNNSRMTQFNPDAIYSVTYAAHWNMCEFFISLLRRAIFSNSNWVTGHWWQTLNNSFSNLGPTPVFVTSGA